MDPLPERVTMLDWNRKSVSKNHWPLPPKEYSKELNQIMMKCLELEPEDRIDSERLVCQVAIGKERYSLQLEEREREKKKQRQKETKRGFYRHKVARR